MRIDRYLSLVAAAACLLLLTGCLDYEEEMTINDDLSGEAEVTITLPDALLGKFTAVADDFAPEKIQKRFEKMSGVSLVSYSVNEEKRRPVANLKITFSSLEALSKALADNPPAAALGGQFETAKEDGKLKITRKLGTTDIPSVGLGDGDFVQYVTHFNSPLAYTNSTRHDGAHNTVRYRWKLDEIFSQQPVMISSIGKPLPWMWILLSAAVIGGGALIGWKTMSKPRRR